MIMLAFAVRDKAVEAYMPVFMCRSKGEAIRSFTMAVRDVKHQFAASKIDYDLFYIGSFDDQDGLLISDGPQRLLGAVEVGEE